MHPKTRDPRESSISMGYLLGHPRPPGGQFTRDLPTPQVYMMVFRAQNAEPASVIGRRSSMHGTRYGSAVCLFLWVPSQPPAYYLLPERLFAKLRLAKYAQTARRSSFCHTISIDHLSIWVARIPGRVTDATCDYIALRAPDCWCYATIRHGSRRFDLFSKLSPQAKILSQRRSGSFWKGCDCNG